MKEKQEARKIWKLWKCGAKKLSEMTEDEKRLLRKYYPFLRGVI